MSESSIIGEHQSAVTTTIWFAGERWMIGWAEGSHEPTLVTANGSTDPVATAIADSIVDADATGTFVAVPSPPQDFQFSFDPESFPVFSATVADDSDPDLLLQTETP